MSYNKDIRQIGTFGVDSGSVMIIDPCYVLPDDRKDWPADLPGNNGTPSAWSDIGHYGDETSVYLNAAMPTCDAPNYHEWGGGMVLSTLWGDGEYPVFAEFNKDGRVVRVTIDFDYDPGDEDDDESYKYDFEDDDDDQEFLEGKGQE